MFDKTTNPAPAGLSTATEEGPELEIAIDEEPEEGTEIDAEPPLPPPSFGSNLAKYIDEDVLASLAADLMEEVDNDLASRENWEKTYTEGLELLGMRIEERTEPWSGACGIFHPLLAEAIVRFQAESIAETFPAAGPVKTKVVGKADKDKEAAAERVRVDMNYQITEVMTEYRGEHERLLWNVGAAGCGFKKVYFDPALGRQVSLFVPAEDVIVSYGAADLYTAQRVTHRMKKTRLEYEKLVASGFYVDAELDEDPVQDQTEIEAQKDKLTGQDGSDDDRYTFYEIQADVEIEGFEDPSDLPLPYVFHIDKATHEVLAVYRNWKENDPYKLRRQHFVKYGYVPGFGFYEMGLIHLVGGFAKGATSMIRQLIDAGTLSNLPGGLKTRGLRIKGDDTPISPGEWRDVDVPGGAIKDNILPLPYKEPSATLYQLYKDIVEEGRRFANTSDADVSDMNKEAPVGTTLALLERVLKSSNAVQARIHASMKMEFKLLKEIIAENAPQQYDYDTAGGREVMQQDYATTEVIPVSDPNAATMSQRVVQYQSAMQLAQQAPQIYDLAFLHGQMLTVLGIKDVDKCIPGSKEQKPKDPITENMNILNMKPVKAFIGQDHQAHLQVHQAAMQDPILAETIGQNPQAQKIMAAAQAHICEHLGFLYRQQMEGMSGMQLPPMDQEDLSPEQEAQIARAAAMASQQLLSQNQQYAAQKQALAMAQDPVVQAQQADIKIKMAEVDRKAKKDAMDAQLEQERIRILEKSVDMQQETAAFNKMTDAAIQGRAQNMQQEQHHEREAHGVAKQALGHMIGAQKRQTGVGGDE